jgi:hypothetical protein
MGSSLEMGPSILHWIKRTIEK